MRTRLRYLFVDINTQESYLGSTGIFAGNPQLPILTRSLKELQTSLLEERQIVLAGVTINIDAAPQPLDPQRFGTLPRAAKIPATLVKGASIIPPDGKRRPWPDLQTLRQRGGQLILEKSEPDLFSNPALSELLRTFNPEELVLFGVPLDDEVLVTAKSARLRGNAVVVLEDAVLPLDPSRNSQIKEELLRLNIHCVEMNELLKNLKPARTKQ